MAELPISRPTTPFLVREKNTVSSLNVQRSRQLTGAYLKLRSKLPANPHPCQGSHASMAILSSAGTLHPPRSACKPCFSRFQRSLGARGPIKPGLSGCHRKRTVAGGALYIEVERWKTAGGWGGPLRRASSTQASAQRKAGSK